MRTLALVGLIMFLSGCATPDWQVVPMQNGNAILINRSTGETWSSDAGAHDWSKLNRATFATSQPTGSDDARAKADAAKTWGHTDSFDTPLSPLTAAQLFVDVAKAAQFSVLYQQGAMFGGASEVAGDSYSAHTAVISSDNLESKLTCKWVKDGQSELRILSDLPEAEYQSFMSKYRAALTNQTKQSKPEQH